MGPLACKSGDWCLGRRTTRTDSAPMGPLACKLSGEASRQTWTSSRSSGTRWDVLGIVPDACERADERIDADRREKADRALGRRAIAGGGERDRHRDPDDDRWAQQREDGDAPSPQHERARDGEWGHDVPAGHRAASHPQAAPLGEHVEAHLLQWLVETGDAAPPSEDHVGQPALVVADVLQ